MTSLQSRDVVWMYEELLKSGMVECNSPKNRKRLYTLLDIKGLKYSKEIIGYTVGTGRITTSLLCGRKFKREIDLPRIMKLIIDKRILAEDLKASCDHLNQHYVCFDFEAIKDIFENRLSIKDKVELVDKEWGHSIKWEKFTPFDFCPLRKTIVRIKLL